MGFISYIRNRIRRGSQDRFLVRCVKKLQVYQYGWVEIKDLNYYDSVREYCKENYCHQYGTNWACPPGMGTIDECRERTAKYERMMLFSKVYHLSSTDLVTDAYENPEVLGMMKDFRDLTIDLQNMAKERIEDFFIYTNGACTICKECTYPDAPCRFPDKCQPALEGTGYMISELANAASMECFIDPKNIIFFGAIVYNYK